VSRRRAMLLADGWYTAACRATPKGSLTAASKTVVHPMQPRHMLTERRQRHSRPGAPDRGFSLAGTQEINETATVWGGGGAGKVTERAIKRFVAEGRVVRVIS